MNHNYHDSNVTNSGHLFSLALLQALTFHPSSPHKKYGLSICTKGMGGGVPACAMYMSNMTCSLSEEEYLHAEMKALG